jgi:hypothetical protein
MLAVGLFRYTLQVEDVTLYYPFAETFFLTWVSTELGHRLFLRQLL